MKKAPFYLFLCLSLSCLLSCKQTIDITFLAISISEKEITVGSIIPITMTVKPDNSDPVPLQWNSSNPSVARVSDGVLYATSPGSTVITVKAPNGIESSPLTITVVSPISSILFDKEQYSVNIGEHLTLNATILPEEANNNKILWYSEDATIASVNDNGLVTAVNKGETTIHVSSLDKAISASCKVIVLVPIDSVYFEKPMYALSLGEERSLNAIITPSNASNNSVSYSFDKPDIVEWKDNAFVAKNDGKVIITVTTEEGQHKASATIYVFGTGIENGHPFTDLGLSVKWATYNIGATHPYEWGDYFAWGETEPKDHYDWGNYKFMVEGEADMNHITKYTKDDGGWSKNGIWYDKNGVFIGDNKTQLDPEDDAAMVKWKGKWRMPTKDEQWELLANCTYTHIEEGELNGYLFTSKINKKQIFLPFTFETTHLEVLDYYSNVWEYWSSTLYYYPYFANNIDAVFDYYPNGEKKYAVVGHTFSHRCYGYPIRAVF